MGEYGGRVDVARSVVHAGGESAILVSVEHVGPSRHDEVPPGKQCRCGMINFGDWPQRRKVGHWKKGAGC